MAGFFPLGGGTERGGNSTNQDDHQERLFWYKNEDVPYKGFELLQQQQLVQNQTAGTGTSTHHYPQDLYASTAGRSSMNVSDDSSSRSGLMITRTSCQDCGNQAKKDCVYMRCRTCCKNRRFECSPHVKSTWVPASKRRERQQLTLSQQQQLTLSQQQQLTLSQQQQQQQVHEIREEILKRPHGEIPINSSSSLACYTRLPSDTSEVENFPAEVSSPAVFQCVRMSSIDDGEDDQIAYQTAVNMGGHVFKGILYDHGPAGESCFGGGVQVQPLNLISASTKATTGGAAIVDPSTLYPAPLNSYMAGTQFFLPPRS